MNVDIGIRDHIESMKMTASHDHAVSDSIKDRKSKMDSALIATFEAGRACGFRAGWMEGFRSPGRVLRMIDELYSGADSK